MVVNALQRKGVSMEIFEHFDGSFWIIIGVYAISTIARAIIMRSYNLYSSMSIDSQITGSEAAMRILAGNHISDVYVHPIPGVLTDNYNRKSKAISLSEDNYSTSSVAAVSIAAHEACHAIQVDEKYTPMTALVVIKPIVRITTMLFIPFFIVSAIANFTISSDIILYFFIGIFALQLVTLPVEFNASNRALTELQDKGILAADEVFSAKKMLRAAALTYIASALITFILAMRARKR
jgi:Zn-dependent membrane protease YugP